MISEGFTEAELKDAISGFIQSRGKNRSDDGYLVNRLNDYLNLNRTLLWDDSLDKTVSTLTPSTVNAAMKKWITPGDITIVQAGDFK